MWNKLQKILGFDDEQMARFKANPRNVDVASRAPEVLAKTFVVKVVDAHGCASGHQTGDEFRFDGVGNLLTEHCPSRVCLYALQALTPMIFAANEMLYAGADPGQMRFNRTQCFDVGLDCGGWGRVVMELNVEDRT